MDGLTEYLCAMFEMKANDSFWWNTRLTFPGKVTSGCTADISDEQTTKNSVVEEDEAALIASEGPLNVLRLVPVTEVFLTCLPYIHFVIFPSRSAENKAWKTRVQGGGWNSAYVSSLFSLLFRSFILAVLLISNVKL